MSNVYNSPLERLAIKLKASFPSIAANPYDAEEDLWVRVGLLKGANVKGDNLPLDELRVRVLEKLTLS